jgi:Uma2 family endonuclease
MARADVPNDVLAAFHEIDGRLPEGFRTQVVDHEIVVSHVPDGDHESIVSWVMKQVSRYAEQDLHCSARRGLVVPGGRYVPDCTIAPVGHFRGHAAWAPADGVSMVVEVASGVADHDRLRKPYGYAAAGIPLYLLIDRTAHEVVLYGKPDGEAYHAQLREPFGRDVELPAPFSFALSTTEFR